MPKTKLSFPQGDVKKLEVAADITNVTLGKRVPIGDEVHIEVSYRDASSLVKMIRLIDKVSGNELDETKTKKSEPEKIATVQTSYPSSAVQAKPALGGKK